MKAKKIKKSRQINKILQRVILKPKILSELRKRLLSNDIVE